MEPKFSIKTISGYSTLESVVSKTVEKLQTQKAV